jgi:hypothetical protein
MLLVLIKQGQIDVSLICENPSPGSSWGWMAISVAKWNILVECDIQPLILSSNLNREMGVFRNQNET